MVKRSLIFLLSIVLLYPMFAGAGELRLTRDKGKYDLAPSLHYLVDEKGEMDFEEIRRGDREGQFIANEKSSLNFGFSDASYWVRFNLTGDTISESGWFLEFTYPAIDIQTLYIPDASGNYVEKKIGDSIPFDEWDVPFFHPTLLLGTELPQNQPIYINIRTGGTVQIDPILWHVREYINHVSSLKMGLGIYYGIMLGLIMYNLFIYFSFRDKNYLLYVCFILAYIMGQITYNGLGFRYFWSDVGWMTNFSYSFFMSFLFIPMILFARSFLQVKKYTPKVDRLFSVLIIVYVFLSTVVHLILGINMLSALFSLVTVSLIYYSAVIALLKGLHSARFFLLAWTALIFGILILLLKMLGVLPNNFFTEYSVQIGSAIEALLLSLALADRMQMMKKEKELAQSIALEETKKSEAMKTRFLEESEKLVEERTFELSKARSELEKLSRLDSLTGLFNRRVFDEVYSREFSRAKRGGNDFSLLVIDVDYFKKYNDRYGHQKGDECLQAIAGCMRKNVQRTTDTLTRYGGEEFAVILAETDMINAIEMAENIRKSIAELTIPHQDSLTKKVTVSIGVTTFKKSEAVSQKVLFERADTALYKAKESGRNRIVHI